jgi:hypothetical protein
MLSQSPPSPGPQRSGRGISKSLIAATVIVIGVLVALIVKATAPAAQPSLVLIVQERLWGISCTPLTQAMEHHGLAVQLGEIHAAGGKVKVPVTSEGEPDRAAVFRVNRNNGDWIVSADDQQTATWYAGCMGANSAQRNTQN